MPNITISLDEEVLRASRDYARRHNTSLNAMIRHMLRQRVLTDYSQGLEECFSLMDEARADSKGQSWNRDEIHER